MYKTLNLTPPGIEVTLDTTEGPRSPGSVSYLEEIVANSLITNKNHNNTGFGEKPILSFETRSRIVFFQSRASRRERDFVHRISSLETRSRILFTESRALRRDREFCSSNLEIRDEIEIFRSFYQNIFLIQEKRCFP